MSYISKQSETFNCCRFIDSLALFLFIALLQTLPCYYILAGIFQQCGRKNRTGKCNNVTNDTCCRYSLLWGEQVIWQFQWKLNRITGAISNIKVPLVINLVMQTPQGLYFDSPRLTSRTTVTSARIPEEDACHRARNFCGFSRVQKGTPRLTHEGCVLKRVFLDALSDVTVVLGMR